MAVPVYRVPLNNIRFVLHDLLKVEELTGLPGYEHATRDVIDAVLEEASKFAEQQVFPLNLRGDTEGCHYQDGEVRFPAGFREAYDAYVAGGWTGITAAQACGGQGLPHLLSVVINEMLCSACVAFTSSPGLTHHACIALEFSASEELKRLFLPPMVAGRWSGTMCLTEPQCGTDLGLIRTRAVAEEDGSYRITGAKIFITAGEHDLTENIVHLVLAKLPDAPPGVRGISLFAVPKFLPVFDGSTHRTGLRNGVRCAGIEHKMGLMASPTCAMNFDDAKGWLIGEPHKGLKAMFVMMNGARLSVGVQSLGLAQMSYQNALAYASDRLQGRSPIGPGTDGIAEPIIVHPDVRKNLLRMKSFTEGARAFAYWVGLHLDLAERLADSAARQEAAEFLALMTPVVKAHLSDEAFTATNIGLQVFGGHGYIRESGMEQYVRDCRICQIYEGANGIQALDLVSRKLLSDNGRLMHRFLDPVEKFISESDSDELRPPIAAFAEAVALLVRLTGYVVGQGQNDPAAAGAAATDYLRVVGLVVLAFMWARMARLAHAKLRDGTSEVEFFTAKVDTARFYMERVLPEIYGLERAIMGGPAAVMTLKAANF
jgi:alkylation response protein AidB-like acyl-CoA dehydrogenase